ncbi:amidinotransferase [Tilletiaria anomala UBC 951]|uniref:Amidinotransferase n=1 Tax=Tilletiaria anomala (strain ATCC 24038 / CBS 436.72 / UBC 951) TaxID=1037660 RepID=A0A066W3V5_TILAU|nr:amidinotransferase [Tilletiaria anomala UBC 951]KDN45445.1 amidinotransferase [Tilletiaria anomala UBC 951]
MKQVLLVREPSSRLAEGQVSHIADQRDAVDAVEARAQWESYIRTFQSLGWEIEKVTPSDKSPDGVFIEDQLVYFAAAGHRPLLLQCSPGASSRIAEVPGAQATAFNLAQKYGLELATIAAPGTLDGGDLLKLGQSKLVYIGQSARTNSDGRRQLRALLEPRGYTVNEVPVTKALHLKSAVTALPDGTVIGWPPIVDDPSLFANFLAIPEEHGVAVVVLGDHEVVMSSDAPQTRALLESRGLKVHAVGVSQFELLEGCVTCLSVRLRSLP